MKRALIIGGSGGLSSEVAKTAMKNGYKVWAVTRGKRELPKGVESIVADRNDVEKFEEALVSKNMKWDVVFDCICMNAEQATTDLKILPQVTNRLIVVSTDSVYDPYSKRTPQTEDGVFIEEEGKTDEVSYGCNKRRMELEFLKDMESENSRLKTTIFRPGHIYGPSFALGCFPENSRQVDLIEHIKAGKPVKLVGMGTYLIHPIFVEDLAMTMVDCVQNEATFNEIFVIGGPEAFENRYYYECIAKELGVKLEVIEVPLKGYLEVHPEYSGHLCHRIYDLSKLRATKVKMPKVHIEDGIRISVRAKLSNGV